MSLFTAGSARHSRSSPLASPNLLRDSDSVLSGYFSMSYAAPHLFGEHIEDFATEARQTPRVAVA
jgi:hypothetical protein